ncbi:MAG: biotin--[acetyl-CoA-carboxylase] ligase [Bacteroidetes bacterium HGW-Bacteroidetes-3]|jgi:BirA family biotin operon repressor/biotin-[acetyl-CoA-carboxylase] ligase|nr:MAG: biotin--[acetyl-CoA-carboxylase] ligase [Bacteroidetes bacterium HGW-Bacteroidetes-3]
MNIIKLDAIESTNLYLKRLAVEKEAESYTVVTANYQTSGRGQMGASWHSESGKNLTFSMLIKFSSFEIEHQFYLSMAVSLGLLAAIRTYISSPLFVKWPNDILADKDKLAGILIENIISGNIIKQTVIGIGLNVNQEKFPPTIGNVTSLKNISGNFYNIDLLLESIVTSIQNFMGYVERKEFESLKKIYLKSLYRFQTPSMFEDNKGTVFLGRIVDILEDGKLLVELDDEKTRKFNFKEIKFASR